MWKYGAECRCTKMEVHSGPRDISEEISGLDRYGIKNAFDRMLSQMGRQRLSDGTRYYQVLVELRAETTMVAHAVITVLVGTQAIEAAFCDAMQGAEG